MGRIGHVKKVWDLADIALGLMAVVNVITIIILTSIILAVTADYNKQRAQNVEPEFNANKVNVKSKAEKGIWH